ncbi:MAG TPA: PAS domain-containing protein [Lichenihabitans sp.]|nr:PAS domain-containing protein [Lichenihabitans sp.]
MKHFICRELFAYWDRLRGARAAPERGDIDPAAIRSLLADTFVLEVTGGFGERDFPIRLAGTRLDALALRPLKGSSFLSLFGRDQHDAVAGLIDIVLDDQAAVVAGLRGRPEGGGAEIDLELLILPLRHHAKTHARLLGALAPHCIPSWLGLRPLEDLTLVSFRNIASPSSRVLSPGRRSSPPAGPVRYNRFTVHQGGR